MQKVWLQHDYAVNLKKEGKELFCPCTSDHIGLWNIFLFSKYANLLAYIPYKGKDASFHVPILLEYPVIDQLLFKVNCYDCFEQTLFF